MSSDETEYVEVDAETSRKIASYKKKYPVVDVGAAQLRKTKSSITSSRTTTTTAKSIRPSRRSTA